jgi:hypothetical protein
MCVVVHLALPIGRRDDVFTARLARPGRSKRRLCANGLGDALDDPCNPWRCWPSVDTPGVHGARTKRH